jgi:tetratricopeptide (TPR) repeat protein
MMVKRQKRYKRHLILTAIIALYGSLCQGQVLMPDLPANRPLILAEEQYGEGHYALAALSARQYLACAGNVTETRNVADIEKAKCYLVLSCLKTNVTGYADTAKYMLQQPVNPAYRQRIAFALAQYYFHSGEYAKAIPLYGSLAVGNLDNTEVADEKFELSYCYFNNLEFDKASPLLTAIIEIKDGRYYKAANYYQGLIAYNKNKYKEALRSFERVADAREYRGVVPYYIAEIYYFMGDRDKALKQADTLINNREKSFYDNELHLLAAQCLFEEQKYTEAIPYFEFYYDHSNKIRKQDLYKIAYCYYKTNEWYNAIEKFKLLSDAKDSLGQTAMYLLGDCYLKTGSKKSARNAFGICADLTFNPAQQEASMILYAKISYETGFDDDALRTLNTLLITFPRTQYRDEANTLVSDLLLKTNNYSGALRHLAEVNKKDEHFKSVYQKVTFGYAVQKFREGKRDSAYHYFSASLLYPVNADYEDAAYFWKGELAFDLHHYPDVINYSNDFIRKKDKASPGRISPLATTQHAYLNMGYASMELQDYGTAQNYFSDARESDDVDTWSGNVAAVKEADAVFMQKNYPRAITLYDRIIATDSVDADYASYQKSILLGLQGKNAEKVAVLERIISKAPPSDYANYARYEMAVSLIEMGRYKDALPFLHQLTDAVADKSFAPKSWMKIGFIHQQLGDYTRSIDAYKHVLIDYPSSEDRLPAADALKSLYIQNNQPSAYTQMLKENNLPSADSGSIDSTYYAAAESQFAAGKWQEAVMGFSNYLQQYPNGIFAVRAHYYRAESNYQLKKYDEAKQDYNTTLSGPWNDFVENSALHAANIAYEQKDYNSAFKYYEQLRANATTSSTKEAALNGLMVSGFHSGDFTETQKYADSLLYYPGISAETINDALYYKAKSLQHSDSNDAAIKIYRQLTGNKNGDVAAESRYQIADMLYAEGKLKEAEAAANETIQLSAGYDFWIVRSYILLADVLVKENDYFNAKATLQSVVKHTNIPELKQEAADKLAEIEKTEKHHSKVTEE